MKIKSIEDLKKLFEILDDRDTVIVSNEDVLQLESGGFVGGNISYPVYENLPNLNTRAISYGGKTIYISLQKTQDIMMDFEFQGKKYSLSIEMYNKNLEL